jgi:hypothetical protein
MLERGEPQLLRDARRLHSALEDAPEASCNQLGLEETLPVTQESTPRPHKYVYGRD